MPGLIRNLRARPYNALRGVAMLLALVALATAGLESISFGHQHLVDGHALLHHHVYLEQHEHHEHPGADHDHDHDHDPPQAPHKRDAPRRTATVAAAPALFQPVVAVVLVAPLASPAPVVPLLARTVIQPAARLTPARAPPAPHAVFDILR